MTTEIVARMTMVITFIGDKLLIFARNWPCLTVQATGYV